MSYDLINLILTELGVEFAYYQFKKPPKGDKYIAYFEMGKDRFLADDKVYEWHPTFAVELYTKTKDLETEDKLIALFEKYEIVWSGGESTWIESEKMYQTVFYC